MKRIHTFFVILFVLTLGYITTALAADVQVFSGYEEDFECAQKLRTALKENNKRGVADLVAYPIVREKPLPSIKSSDEFIKSWDDFFDKEIISRVASAEPEVVGWRGVMLGDGDMWFSHGKIDSINTRTNVFTARFKSAREEEFKILHESARGYKRIRLECHTAHSRIRVQEHADGLYYFVWDKTVALSEKPFLSLRGSEDIQGSAGNMLYTFAAGAQVYKIDDPRVCEEACKVHVIVFKNGTLLSDEACE